MRRRPHLAVAVLALLGAPLGAQQRDSVAARITQAEIDSIDALLDSVLPPARVRHRLSLQGIGRQYDVGTTRVTEIASPITYSATGTRWRLRLAGAPLRYEAPGRRLDGTTPISGRFDWRLRPGDTLTVLVQSASRPAQLDSLDALAIGAAGTSTLDLLAFGLALPAQAAVRGAFAFPTGDVVLNVRLAVEQQRQPTVTTRDVFYRGTTVRGGLGVWGYSGRTRLGAGLEVARSWADSLGGRNLFPGGGIFTLDALLETPVGDEGLLNLSGFYSRPFDNVRNDQPNRLIPIGDFAGVFGTLSLPAGPVILLPSAQLLRESSSATVRQGGPIAVTTSNFSGQGWSLGGSLAVELPIGGGLSLTPEVGALVGRISQTFTTAVQRRGRPPVGRAQTIGERSTGAWAALELAIRF